MYSMVLVVAMTGAPEAPQCCFGWGKGHGCTGYQAAACCPAPAPVAAPCPTPCPPLPDLEAVILPHGAVLFEARDRITHVYFPQRCVISLLAAAGDGEGVEVGLIGNEGMVGLSVFLGATSSTTQAVLQIPDGAWRMEVGAFRRAINQQPALGQVLRRYTQSVISQVTQGLACNQRHAVRPRCARWLLMAHDRVGLDRFELTQEFLGQMLGAQRPTVSITARGLQSLGLIRYARGIITVLNRPGLESAACTCYDVMEADYARAFG